MKSTKLTKYNQYLKLSDEERREKIRKATHEEQNLPNPQQSIRFPENNFIDFQVPSEEGKFVKLMTYRYPAKNEPKAVVLLFHGLNSYINDGAHLAHQLSLKNIETVGFDHRGFGESDGQPAYIHSFDSHMKDCIRFAYRIKQIYGNLPLFCLGLSMGGLSAYRLTLKNPNLFCGAILMAPALKKDIGNALVLLSKFCRLLLPEKTRLHKLPLDRSNRNAAVIASKTEDPLYYKGRVSLATTNQLLTAIKENKNTLKDYRCPFLIVQGGLDRSVDPMGAFQLFEQSPLGEQDKDVLFFQNMWHDIWHEPEIDEIMNQTIRWIELRLQRKSNPEQQKEQYSQK